MSMQTTTAMANYGAPAVAPAPELPQPSKNWGYRIFAIVFIALCAAALFLPYYAIESAAGNAFIKEGKGDTFLAILLGMFKSGNKVLGAIPSYDVFGTMGIVYTLSIYLYAVSIVVAVVLSIIAIFTSKAPGIVRAAIVSLTAGALIYFITFFLAANTVGFMGTTEPATVMDYGSLIIVGVGVILCTIFGLIEVGAVGWIYMLQTLLTLAFTATLSMAMSESVALVASDAGIVDKIFMLVGVAALWVSPIFSFARMANEEGLVCDLVRYILVLLAALLVLFKIDSILFAVVAAVIAIVQIVIVIVHMVIKHNQELAETERAANAAATAGFHVEEYAEAYAYEGGPVAGVLMAEEVNPSFLPQNPHVNTAGYDFYNCKSFDPFIASLDAEERNAFTEIFILKFKGTMSELPDYVVGGDNKDFFRKVFIYLGQYRDRIPMNLLTKMYQFSMKI